MKAQPLSTETSDGVLTITLDTPACPVNIFTHEAAVQLLGIVGGIDTRRTRAVIFRSAKPHSFVNGASLMLASAVGKPEDLTRLTAPIRQAYRALGDLPIPTIEAIRGSCYGCGVELALRCKFRVAGDSYDAHFYMTEIADYLLVPTFGSTQYLPRMLGLESATNFLLWGERWPARRALEHGLIDGCFSDGELDAAAQQVARDLARDGTSPLLRVRGAPARSDVEAFGKRTRERIDRLPPEYRGVYATCYALIERAVLKDTLDAEDLEAEVQASARSVVAPISKASVGFFFVRQLNEQVSLRGAPAPSTFHVRCDMSAEAPRYFRAELEGRRIRGLTFDDLAARPGSPDALEVRAYGSAGLESSSARSLAICDTPEPAAPDLGGGPVLYAPAWRGGAAFVEIAYPEPAADGQRAFRLLARAGIHSITTRPKNTFVTNALLRAYLTPQVAFLAAGGTRWDLAATLLDLGFTRLPGDWLVGWDLDRLALVLDRGGARGVTGLPTTLASLPSTRELEGGTVSPSLENAVLASLLAFARAALREGSVVHPCAIDVAARELIDFPLGKTSLCRYLTVTRARRLGDQASSIASLVGVHVLDSVQQYADGKRDFYR